MVIKLKNNNQYIFYKQTIKIRKYNVIYISNKKIKYLG